MAGGLTGNTKSKPSAATKKRLGDLRNICPEAQQKSNQELILLLENYNDQMDLVAEALRTGEAEGVVGGWATTAKKGKSAKGKKSSESDAGRDNASEASSNQLRSSATAVSAQKAPPQPAVNGISSQGSPSVQSPPPQQQQSQQSQPRRDNKAQSNVSETDNIPSQSEQPQVKDVSVADIHSHAGSFPRLLVDLEENHIDDIKNLDFAFEQIRRSVEHRYETLRRSLERSSEQASEILRRRQRQGADLSEKLVTVSPKDYSEWQQDVTTFLADYKFDSHLATVHRFSHSLDALEKVLRQFGNVSAFAPTYSYTPIDLPSLRQQPERPPTSYSQPPIGTTKQTAPPARSNNTRNNSNNNNQNSNNNNQNNNSNNNASQQRTQTNVRPDNTTQYQTTHPVQEKVTIVPKDVSGNGPMDSLVISGGNLTKEELAKLTSTLQNFQFGANNNNNQPQQLQQQRSGDFGGDFVDPNVFNGGVWTNSNAGNTFANDQWNQGVDMQHNLGFNSAPGGNSFGQPGYENGPMHGFDVNGQPNYSQQNFNGHPNENFNGNSNQNFNPQQGQNFNGQNQNFNGQPNFGNYNNGPPARGGPGMRGRGRGGNNRGNQQNSRGARGGNRGGNNRGRGNNNN